MSQELKHKLFSPTDCLSEQTMFDYIDNKLTPKERHIVEKHLLGCELCSDAMEGLEMLKNRNRIDFINQKINERIAPVIKKETKIISINYRMISGIAAGLLLLVGGVFFFNNFVNKEMKQSDVAELKTPPPPPTVQNQVEKTVTDSEEITTAIGKDKKAKSEPEKTEQQNQLAFAKEEKPSPDYKTTLANAEKGISDNLKQEEAITKSDEDKNAENIPVQTDDSKIVLLEKDVAGDETKEKSKESNVGVAGGYTKTQPTSPSKTVDIEGKAIARNSRKSETKNEVSDNRFRHEAESKKDNANKDEDKQIVVTGNVTSAPQSVTSAYEQKPQTAVNTVSTTTESTAMMDSVSSGVKQIPTPEFPGGKDSLLKFVQNNFTYPSAYYSWNSSLGNQIKVEFTIDNKGNVIHPKIIKGINTELNNEAIRVVNLLPKWQPAVDKGKPVSSIYVLPIELDISTNAKQTKKK